MYVNEIPLEAHDPVEYTRNHPHKAVDKIRELQAENAKLKEELERHRWIPVEERLPDEDGEVFVIRSNLRYPERRFWCNGKWWCPVACITHWKPIILPKE